MALLDNLEIKATGSMDDAIRKVDELIQKVQSLPKSRTVNLRLNTTNTTTEVKKISENVKRVVNEVDKGAKQIQKSVSKASDASSGKLMQLFSSIKRIAVYRLIRTAIKAVTQAFAEGIKNAYQWAVANSDAFQQVMDTYATKSMYLKNTMGALASTILTALLPAFIWLVNKIVAVTNAVNEFIAALTGQDSYLRAKEVAIEFGDAAEDAAGKQKKLNEQLMAFDELNVITSPKNGGTGNDLNNAMDDAFERVNVSEKFSKLSKLVQKIKETFDKFAIPDAVTKAFEAISGSTESIFGFIQKVGEKLQEIGFTEQFSSDVKKIFEKFGDIFEKVKEIQQKLDDLGVSDFLAEALANLLGIVEKLTATSIIDGLNNIANFLDVLSKLLSGDFVGALESLKNTLIDLLASVLRPVAVLMDYGEKAVAKVTKTDSVEILAGFEKMVNEWKGIYETPKAATGTPGIMRYAGYNELYDYDQPVIKTDGFTGGGAGHGFGTGVTADEFEGGGNGKAFASKGILDVIERSLNEGASALAQGLNNMLSRETGVGTSTNSIIPKFSVRANGGFPEMGSIFAAGEVPGKAEFVGNINGRTGVASGQEITGIADAVYATGNEEANLLRELVAVVKAGGGSMQPSAAFGRFASQSIRLYKGVTG